MPSVEQQDTARSIDRGEVTLDEIAAALGRGGLDLDLGLVALERRRRSASDAAALRGLAALLPRRVPRDPSASRRLAGLYERLWTWLEGPVLPDWRSSPGPIAARLAWLRTAALTDPAAIAGLVDEREPLRQALDGLPVDALLRPAATLLALARAPAAGLQAIADRLLAPALHRALITPSEAHSIAAALAHGSSLSLRRAALERLAEPWAAGFPLPLPLLKDALAGDERLAAAALACARVRGLAGVVASVVADEEAPPQLRQAALRALAELEGAEVSPLLGAALSDPVLFAGPAIDALGALHRRGVFLRDPDLGDLLALYAADLRVDPIAVARIAYTSRRALAERLRAGKPAALGLDRRVELLLAVDRSVAGPEDMSLVPWLLEQLETAEDPRPILAALARHPRALALEDDARAAVEARVLPHLDARPSAALEALRVHGGEATRAALRRGLGIEPPGPIETALIADHEAALALLWHLGAEDRGARAALLRAIAVEPLPRAILDDLGPTVDPDEEAILARRRAALPRDRSGRARRLVAVIEGLARADRAALVPELGRALVDLAEAIGDGDDLDEHAHGEAREQLPEAVLRAVRGLGERLFQRARIRPPTICAASDAPAAGQTLLAELLARAVAEVADAPKTLAVLLRTLVGAPHPRNRAAILGLRRRSDPAIRKLVIPLTVQCGADDLASDLRALVAADDLESARQAVIALGSIGAREHADAIASILDHPTMNLKKAAAEALAVAGSPAVVGRILFWLGHHDNPGLRALLLAALDAILGDAATATILAALEREADPRRRALVIDALDRRLEATALRIHAGAGVSWARELLAALHAGALRPRGDAAALRAELERHGLATPREKGPEAAIDPAILALERRGLDEGQAADLLDRLADAPLRPYERRRLRPHLGAWLEWARREPSRGGAVLDLIATIVCDDASAPSASASNAAPSRAPTAATGAFAHAPRAALASAEGALLARHLPALLDALEAAPASDPDARGRLLALADALAPVLGPAEALLLGHVLRDLSIGPNSTGRSALAALRRAGLVIESRDLDRALADAAGTADPAALERAILGEAFLVDGGDPSDLEEGAARRLDDALVAGDPAAIEALRAEWAAPVRATVLRLVAAFPGLPERARAPALAWLHALQPLDAPAWDRPLERDRPLRPSAHAPTQPPSAARLQFLLRRLDAARPEDREEAVRGLARWPDLKIRRIARDAYLGGRIDDDAIDDHLRDLGPVEPSVLARTLSDDRVERIERWLSRAPVPEDMVPALVTCWLAADRRAIDEALARVLARVPPHRVFQAVTTALRRGQWGALALVHGPLHPRALPGDLLSHPGAGAFSGLAERLAALLPRPEATAPSPTEPTIDRAALFERLGDLESRAPADALIADLKLLAKIPDDPFVALCRALLRHAAPRLRLAALRQLRRHGAREDVLEASRVLLDDARADVRRSAIQSLAHAGDEAAIPAILALVDDPHNGVRRAATSAVARYGPRARGPLVAAIRGARPDRRALYQALLDALDDPA
ncbi:MAG: HEAT repeat domain-containing protein [Nannocystaceae bacterium]